MAELVLETEDFLVIKEDGLMVIEKQNSRVLKHGTARDLAEDEVEVKARHGNIRYIWFPDKRWVRGEYIEEPPDHIKRRITAEEL